jgi:16S rRNA (cytidine1402-2'-O)-methyltransferase
MSILYIVATPIGNLSDASGRSIEILGAVDGILAEDTRRTRKLLDRYDLRTSLTSLHGHNETSRIPRVVTRLDAGESLALVSDAGTPLLSDPGERLVRAVLDAGHTVTPVPGPSAILSALMGAGFATVPFIFHGFVPRKGKPRQVMLEQIASVPETSVVFESPERVATLLRALAAVVADDRQVVVAREMTKIHEEFFRGTMAEAARYYEENKARGEVTVVVSPRSPAEGMAEGRESVDEVAARALARALVDEGLNLSRAAREVSSRLGIAKNAAYEIVHSLESDSEEELG